MKLSNNGLALIKRFEGLRTKAYKDSSGVLTIGYGTTNDVFNYTKYRIDENSKITEEKAEQLLLLALRRFENHVNTFNSRFHYNFSQNQFDALVSFAYNIGSINELTDNGKRTKEQISDSITKYVKSGGKTLQGLVNRRLAEKELFDSDLKKSNEEKYSHDSDVRIYGKVGMKGTTISIIQLLVGAKVDGVYGEETKQCVMGYQRYVNRYLRLYGRKDKLIVDGIVGTETMNCMIYDIKNKII